MIFTKMLKWSEVAQSCPTLCDPMDCSHPWDFPGKSTGMGCHVVLQITDMSGDLISKSESYYVKEAKVKPKSVYKSLWLISDNSICFPKELYWLKMIPEPKIVLLHFFWWENWVVLTPNRDYHARNQIPILNQYPFSYTHSNSLYQISPYQLDCV